MVSKYKLELPLITFLTLYSSHNFLIACEQCYISDIGLPPKTPTNVMTPVKRTFSNAASVPSRQHCFIQKSVKVTEKCNPCGKRIKFGKIFFKCQDCEIVCHKECRLQVVQKNKKYHTVKSNTKAVPLNLHSFGY